MLVSAVPSTVLGFSIIWLVIKVLIFILGIFYMIFTLVVVQQVRLMTKSLITEVSPILRAFSIFQVGFGIAILFLLFGVLFGRI